MNNIMINIRVEVSTNSAELPEMERDCRKDERHEDRSIDQQHGTSHSTNNEFVTQMEVSANSAEFPEVKMDFLFILWTLKNSCIFISTQWKDRSIVLNLLKGLQKR